MLRGRINRFPGVGIKLAGAEIPTEGWPSVLQVVDSQILAKKLGYSVFPFQIELDKGLPDGFNRELANNNNYVARTTYSLCDSMVCTGIYAYNTIYLVQF